MIHTSVNFIISLFNFCLDGLLIGESEVLKSSTINVWCLIYGLTFSNVSLMNVDAFVFGACMSSIPQGYLLNCVHNSFIHNS